MNGMTIGELSSLLASNGLPAGTPVTVRITDASSESTLQVQRVQVVRQLQPPRMLAAGQSPEFVVEIVVQRPPQRLSGQHMALPDHR